MLELEVTALELVLSRIPQTTQESKNGSNQHKLEKTRQLVGKNEERSIGTIGKLCHYELLVGDHQENGA
jgi:hypothetical protein